MEKCVCSLAFSVSRPRRGRLCMCDWVCFKFSIVENMRSDFFLQAWVAIVIPCFIMHLSGSPLTFLMWYKQCSLLKSIGGKPTSAYLEKTVVLWAEMCTGVRRAVLALILHTMLCCCCSLPDACLSLWHHACEPYPICSGAVFIQEAGGLVMLWQAWWCGPTNEWSLIHHQRTIW